MLFFPEEIFLLIFVVLNVKPATIVTENDFTK
jgi:hypothetical protein